jgi:hypothetical protein
MSFIVSTDPHVKKSAIAVFMDSKLSNITTVNTDQLISHPGNALGLEPLSRSIHQDRHLVIERPFVGKNPHGSITLAITVGKIMGSFIRSGFEIHEAPAWGVDNSWISDMLSLGQRMPTRKQVAKLSIKIAKTEYPDFEIDEHSAAAILIGMWFMKKIRMHKTIN